MPIIPKTPEITKPKVIPPPPVEVPIVQQRAFQPIEDYLENPSFMAQK